MSNEPVTGLPIPPNRAGRIVEAGLAAFGATTGALLVFGHQRGGAWAPFADVGRHVARDIVLPVWGDVSIGLAVHLGHSLALGAVAVLVRGATRSLSRVRAALVVAVLWQLASLVPWLAVIRADMTIRLTTGERVALILLMVAALTLGPKRD